MILSRRKLFFLLLLIVALFQVASIFSPHVEGDELVYLSLSQNMGWDFSNYTVMNTAPLNRFSNKLYREPIFVHPPLFPLILKAGTNLVNPVLFGILFNGLLKFALAVLIWYFALALGASQSAARLMAVFVTACPVLGFIGSRILVDMVFTLSLVAVLYLLIRAGKENPQKNLMGAAVCCCILLNTKFQAVFYLPLFVFLYIEVAGNALKEGNLTKAALRSQVFCALLLIGLIGFAHYYNLLYSLGLQECLHLFDSERPLNPFILRISARSTLKFLLYLLILHPIVLLLIRPHLWFEIRKSPGTIPKPVLYIIITLLYSILVILLSSGAQERYWAHVFPLVFLLVTITYEKVNHNSSAAAIDLKFIYAGYLVLLFMNNFETNVLLAGSRTAIVYPALLEIFPFLAMSGGPFFNF